MKGLNTIFLIAALSMAGTPAFADDELEFKAELSGAEEVPPVDTDTTGEAEFEVNEDFTRIDFKLEIEDAVGILGAAGAHIHCAPKGANGPVVAFLAGSVPPAGFDGDVEIEATLTNSSIVNANTDCGATIAELVEAMLDGETYVNVHSAANPSGEVRGQIRGDDD